VTFEVAWMTVADPPDMVEFPPIVEFEPIVELDPEMRTLTCPAFEGRLTYSDELRAERPIV